MPITSRSNRGRRSHASGARPERGALRVGALAIAGLAAALLGLAVVEALTGTAVPPLPARATEAALLGMLGLVTLSVALGLYALQLSMGRGEAALGALVGARDLLRGEETTRERTEQTRAAAEQARLERERAREGRERLRERGERWRAQEEQARTGAEHERIERERERMGAEAARRAGERESLGPPEVLLEQARELCARLEEERREVEALQAHAQALRREVEEQIGEPGEGRGGPGR